MERTTVTGPDEREWSLLCMTLMLRRKTGRDGEAGTDRTAETRVDRGW
jgi:hypothetical protein